MRRSCGMLPRGDTSKGVLHVRKSAHRSCDVSAHSAPLG